jgi:hypothetical protein
MGFGRVLLLQPTPYAHNMKQRRDVNVEHRVLLVALIHQAVQI